MGKYLDILRADSCDKSDKSDKSYAPVPSPFSRFGRFGRTFAELEQRCPDYVDPGRWHQAVEDGRRFLATWGSQAEGLGWTPAEVFGLPNPPSNPHPSYDRMARYDTKGLVWLLEGRTIVAMSSSTAAIQHKTGAITSYRKHNKPGLGPLGDSSDDFK
jgi:hypothetical protein